MYRVFINGSFLCDVDKRMLSILIRLVTTDIGTVSFTFLGDDGNDI